MHPEPPLHGVQCVLFDLDGTLVDSRRDIACALNRALERHELRPIETTLAASFVGDGVRKLVERALEATGGDMGDVDLVADTYLDAYRASHLETTGLYPGVREVLATLRERGIACGIVTNKPYEFSVSLMAHLGVEDRFRIILGGDSGHARKPSPEPLLAAMAACGAVPSTSIMVGDGEADVLAGRASGAFTVAVTYGFRSRARLEEAGPGVVIDTLPELLPLIA